MSREMTFSLVIGIIIVAILLVIVMYSLFSAKTNLFESMGNFVKFIVPG